MRSVNRPDPRFAFAFANAVIDAFGRAGGVLWTRTMGRTLLRALPLPSGPRVIAIGGATLGGSGKTPLAIACAEHLAAMGARVTIVGHAYRARPGGARVVSPSDRLEDVGDEALLAARIFAANDGAPAAAPGASGCARPRVVVAPSRAAAMASAARESDVLILDGVAQTAPARVSLALLALDARQPWGRGALPPLGDLRATVPALLDACDAVVPIQDDADPANDPEPLHDERIRLRGKDVLAARAESRGAWDASGVLRTWEVLRSVRVGLLTALARPERVIAALARRGIEPHAVLIGRDHGPIAAGAAIRTGAAKRVDLWLVTPKCALHVERARPALPVATLDYSVVLPPRLCARLARVLHTSCARHRRSPCLDRREPGP